jgi:hypothetical protein
MNQTAAATAQGMSAATRHENRVVSSVVRSHTPTRARSRATEPGAAASNLRRQSKSRTRQAYEARTKIVAAASPRDLRTAMMELPVRKRNPITIYNAMTTSKPVRRGSDDGVRLFWKLVADVTMELC